MTKKWRLSLLCLLVAVMCCLGASLAGYHKAPVLTEVARRRMSPHFNLYMQGWMTENKVALFYGHPSVRYGHPYKNVVHNLDTEQETDFLAYYTKYIGTKETAGYIPRLPLKGEALPLAVRNRLSQTLLPLLPKLAKVGDCWLSPDTKRMLVCMKYRVENPAKQLLHNLYAAYPLQSVPVIAIWVTKQNGSAPYLLGTQEGQPDSDFKDPSTPSISWSHTLLRQIVWSPNGKEIAFVHQDALYIAPVP